MMMKPALSFAAALMLCAACGGESPQPASDARATAAPPLAPPILQPEEATDPSEPPSYEVAIASVAAERNAAKKRCETQPESVRAQCEQEANAAFSDASKDLDRLRGNTP